MDHLNRDVVTHVHRPDAVYDQAADVAAGPVDALRGWRSLTLLLTAPGLLVAAGMLTYLGAFDGQPWQLAAGITAGVLGALEVVALWVRGERP